MKPGARMAATALGAALVATLSGCINLHFDRATVSEPITDAMLVKLKPGTSDLSACLGALGAPQLTYEQPHGRYALVWYWNDELDWGVSVSMPITQGANASYQYSDTQLDQPGVLLLFDDRDVVQQIRRGRLSELTVEADRKPRPNYIEDGEQSATRRAP